MVVYIPLHSCFGEATEGASTSATRLVPFFLTWTLETGQKGVGQSYGYHWSLCKHGYRPWGLGGECRVQAVIQSRLNPSGFPFWKSTPGFTSTLTSENGTSRRVPVQQVLNCTGNSRTLGAHPCRWRVLPRFPLVVLKVTCWFEYDPWLGCSKAICKILAFYGLRKGAWLYNRYNGEYALGLANVPF